MAEIDKVAISQIQKMLDYDLTAAYASEDPGQRGDIACNYLNMLLKILSEGNDEKA